MDWQSCKAAFANDGFSRHIRAEGLTLRGWNRCYRVLRASDARLHLHRDGEPQPLPERLDVAPFASSHRYLLSLNLAGMQLICHLDELERLDLEFDPAAVNSPARALILFRIMSMLGRRLNQPVVLTHPARFAPLFRYRPGGEGVEYLG
jgi:hypothetical protein